MTNPPNHKSAQPLTITTTPIAEPDTGDWCCNGEPATLDVYANGRFHCTACALCVDTVPGYGGGLKLDDIIPSSWEALSPTGEILLRVHAGSADEASRVYRSWRNADGRLPSAASVRQTTARTLFQL
jgi:hypothetical protein